VRGRRVSRRRALGAHARAAPRRGGAAHGNRRGRPASPPRGIAGIGKGRLTLKHCVDDGADPTCSPIRAGLRGLVVSSIVFDMYVVDTMDEVEELPDVPRSDVGAPCPLRQRLSLIRDCHEKYEPTE
jgi:hypothetical protein